MDQLSYVYDEENHETVYKTLISQLFAMMSDHSSVNKKFNRDLGKHRHMLLTLAVNLYIFIAMHIVYWAFHIIVNQPYMNLNKKFENKLCHFID